MSQRLKKNALDIDLVLGVLLGWASSGLAHLDWVWTLDFNVWVRPGSKIRAHLVFESDSDKVIKSPKSEA